MRAPRRSSRRAFLISGLAAAGVAAEKQKPPVFPSELRRYSDPTTEFEVFRLTDPEHSSRMTAYYGRGLSRRSGFLLYSSDRTGAWQAFRMDLRTGESLKFTDAENVDPHSLNLLPDERNFAYFAGGQLRVRNFGTMRERVVYEIPAGWERSPGVSITGDGIYALFGEQRPGANRLRIVSLARGAARTIAETESACRDPIPRPRRDQALYRQGDNQLWLVDFDGKPNRRLKISDGGLGPANWAPDGRTVLYLNFPEDKTQLNSIREFTPDQNADKLVAKTSQFVAFGFNGNTSVFVGASRNKASPTLLLLLRITRRELTLCEHRASDPASVAPVFSADSQRIYFQSDRHGKPAIYSIHVERLVEKIESEA